VPRATKVRLVDTGTKEEIVDDLDDRDERNWRWRTLEGLAKWTRFAATGPHHAGNASRLSDGGVLDASGWSGSTYLPVSHGGGVEG
jgi:hypothetical protein